MKDDFFYHSLSEITHLHFFFLLAKMVIPQRFRFYLDFSCYRRLIAMFGLSSTYYDVMFFIVLLLLFICVGDIQIGKTDLINQRYQIIVDEYIKYSLQLYILLSF